MSCYPSQHSSTPAGLRRESMWPGPIATSPTLGRVLLSKLSKTKRSASLLAFGTAFWLGQSLTPRPCTPGTRTWWEATSTAARSLACSSSCGRPGASMAPRSRAFTSAPRPHHRAAVSTACVVTGLRSAPSGAIKDLEHSEIIIRRRPCHEALDFAQNPLDGGAFESGLQPVLAKKIPIQAFRLGNAVRGQHNPVSGLELQPVRNERSFFDQSHHHVGVFQAPDSGAIRQHGLHMSAIDVFEGAVRSQLDQNHGGVFLHVFLANITIGHICDLRQRLTSQQQSVKQTLQSRGKNGRRHTFAGDIGNHYVEAGRGRDHVVKIAPHLLAGDAPSV